MEVCADSEAYSKGWKKFMGQRYFGKVYLLTCKIGRRSLTAICTEADVKKYKLNADVAGLVFGNTDRERSNWDDWRHNPDLQKERQLSRYIRAHKTMNSISDKWRKKDDAEGQPGGDSDCDRI